MVITKLKRKCHCHKNLSLMDDVDINKILISNMVSSYEKIYKYFIGYKDNGYKIKPLYIILPQMGGDTKCFDETKCTYFLKKDDKWLENYKKSGKK